MFLCSRYGGFLAGISVGKTRSMSCSRLLLKAPQCSSQQIAWVLALALQSRGFFSAYSTWEWRQIEASSLSFFWNELQRNSKDSYFTHTDNGAMVVANKIRSSNCRYSNQNPQIQWRLRQQKVQAT